MTMSWVPALTRACTLVALFLGCAAAMPLTEPFFRGLFPDLSNPFYTRHRFLDLALDHIRLVGTATLIAIAVGVGAAVAVTRHSGREFLPLVSTVATIGQTFPPAAVLAVAVPIAGYGFTPAVVALILYGQLPIVQNTIAGLRNVPHATIDAARGMGMTPRQILLQVELPLALPVIIAGIRVSVLINIGTATIASTVGASSLGTPIISGLVAHNTAYLLQGALLVGLMAVTADRLIGLLEQAATSYRTAADKPPRNAV